MASLEPVVEKLLAPGETVRFERGAVGWPRLGATAALLYLMAFVPIFCLALTGASYPVALGPIKLGVPFFLAFVGIVVPGELLRVALHRSTLHVVTSARVLTLRGIYRQHLRSSIERARVVDVEVVAGDPALQLADRIVPLTGLGVDCIDAVRLALDLPAANAAVAPPTRRRELLLVIVALALLVVGHVFGLVGLADVAAFQAVDGRLLNAIGRAEKAFIAESGLNLDAAGSRSMTGGPLVDRKSELGVRIIDFSRRERRDASQPLSVVMVDVEHVLPWRPLLWGTPRVVITELGAFEDSRFLVHLKRELAAEGIDATWPAGR